MLKACVLAAVLILSACGDSGESTDESDPGNSATSGDNNEPAVITPPVVNPVVPDTIPETGTPTTPATEVDQPTTPTDTTAQLAALPSPALTEGPAADDEPVLENGEFDSITGFTPTRNPGPRIPKDEPVDVSLEDFLAGPLEAVVEVPPGVDTATNNPPFFINLTDQEIFAGETLNVRYQPADPDGGLPGMFPEELPEGSSFEDNFDGTKSFIWQPLQGDVGIREFTVVALDPLNSLYRTRRTIRIKIDLPTDPSTIPNKPPRIEEFVPHTVRAGDPVVIELRGRDLNDTIPILTIPNPPANSSFNQHPLFDEIYVLQYTPNTPGIQTIDVVSVDADDPGLTTAESITIEVLAASDFERSGTALRDLAANRDFMIGFAARQEFYHRPDGEIYAATAAREFNLLTPENSMKMDLVNPLPGRYQFADADNLVTFAQQNNMTLHGHPLLWYTQVPEWVEESEPADREVIMREYIIRVLQRYQNSIKLWDIVNEPVDEIGNPRNSVWFQGMGEEYIDIAYLQARRTLPDGVLILNDYDIEVNGPKSDGFFNLVERLKSRNVPIDAIGFQMHLFTTFDQFDEVQQKFQRAVDLDLDFYITELDVSFPEGTAQGSVQRDLQQQAAVYRRVLELCLEQPRCKALQAWGFTDQYSWREPLEPLMFDARYQVKPAYTALQQVLAGP